MAIRTTKKAAKSERKSAKEPKLQKPKAAKAVKAPRAPKAPRVRKKKLAPFDMVFFLLVLVLVAFGMVMVFSASYATALSKWGDSFHYIKKHAVFVAAGLVAMYIFSRIPYTAYLKTTGMIYTLGISLMTLVVVLNKGKAGRWLQFGSFTFQPSEAMKLAIIVVFAALVSQNYNRMQTFKFGVKPFGLALLPVVAILMLFQHHLSATIIICGIGLMMMFVGGTPIKYFLSLLPVGVAAIAGLVMVKGVDYMMNRVSSWLNPAADPTGDSWQTLQSMIAIGSGGVMGLGLGNSRQKYLYLPEPQNDFIFAIVCEELGLIGAILVIALFVFLIYRGFMIANKAPNKFAAMLVVGITLQIAIQTLLNIAVVTNSIPNTGISLPFFSAGGTSLVMLLIEVGIVLNVSRYSTEEKP